MLNCACHHNNKRKIFMQNTKITFIGCGNMGQSLIGGLIADGYPADLLCGSDIDAAQRQQVSGRYGIETLEDNQRAVQGADIVVLAVKPQLVKQTLRPLCDELARNKPLLLSVAAGIRLQDLSRWAGNRLAIVRAMPNLPSLIQAGAAALCANQHVDSRQRDNAEAIMRAVGITIWLEEEGLIDAVTALSGSGPAYFFYIMEIMENAAHDLGLNKEKARILTLQTALGAAKMALESKHDPATLRKQVTSPGGTTERALQVLHAGDFAGLFTQAIKAACARAGELAGTLED